MAWSCGGVLGEWSSYFGYRYGPPCCSETGVKGQTGERRLGGKTGEGVEPLTKLVGGTEAGCLERGRGAGG